MRNNFSCLIKTSCRVFRLNVESNFRILWGFIHTLRHKFHSEYSELGREKFLSNRLIWSDISILFLFRFLEDLTTSCFIIFICTWPLNGNFSSLFYPLYFIICSPDLKVLNRLSNCFYNIIFLFRILACDLPLLVTTLSNSCSFREQHNKTISLNYC